MAEVQPPPVVLYPQSQDESHNSGAGHYSQGGSAIRPIEPPPQPPVDPRYPPQYDPRFPDQRNTGHTDGRLATHHTENRYPVTPQRRPNPPVPHPAGHGDTSSSGVSTLLLLNHQQTFSCNNLTLAFIMGLLYGVSSRQSQGNTMLHS